MQGKHGHLSREQKQLALRLHSKGWRLIDIAREVGCTAPMVGKMAREGRHLDGKPFGWEPRAGHLTVLDRERILVGLARGDSLTLIARHLGRAVSTISREVRRGGGRAAYSAWRAHEHAREQARRPKPFKLGTDPLLREVTARLKNLWSPQEVSARLRLEYPNDPEMHVSHETIYQSLFVQGRGQLRRELARCLRSGRTVRRPRTATDSRGRLPGMVMISERPAEVEDRAVPGHWALPSTLARSITWDQGAEMAQHAIFTAATGIPIYFCDPHSPWQRGSNENTNGLLRQYLPKSTDLSVVTRAELMAIQDSLNGRPRKTLGYLTPSEKFMELVATTT